MVHVSHVSISPTQFARCVKGLRRRKMEDGVSSSTFEISSFRKLGFCYFVLMIFIGLLMYKKCETRFERTRIKEIKIGYKYLEIFFLLMRKEKIKQE